MNLYYNQKKGYPLFKGMLTVIILFVIFINVSYATQKSEETNSKAAEEMFDQKSVSGIVTDENGQPLPGVTVVIKGTTQGTVTGADGKYTLESVPSNGILVFSFVGMKSQEIEVGNQSVVDVSMVVDAIGLEEVVAVGYGVQKKTTVTGAISTVQGEDLAEIPVPNVSQTLAGKLAGVSMRHPNGAQPGMDTPDIHIRGVVTTGNSAPLVIVDGVKRDNIQQIDPSSIESITILKDAAAVAPYGIGGANGVILITTKKGRIGRPTVRLNTTYGIQNPTFVPKMVNATDYMTLQNEGYYNTVPDGDTPPNDPDLIANYNELHQEDPYRYPDSYFPDVWNDNIPVQNHNLELSGGTDKVNYYAGLGFYDQKGLFDPVGYQRYNYNLSLEMEPTNTTKVGMSLYGSTEITKDLDPGENASGHLLRAFYKFVPIQQLIYPDGEHWGESSASSPVAAIRSDGYERWNKSTLLGSVFVEQQLPFIQGLSIKGVFSYDPTSEAQKQWHLPFIYHVIDLDTDPYSFEEAVTLQEGNAPGYIYLEQNQREWRNYTGQFYVNYNRTFGDHNVTGLLVAEARKNTYSRIMARRNNFALEIDELDFGSSDKTDFDNGGSSSEGSEIGYVYRIGYSYKEKYLLEASGRYDGHYYFAPGRRWGYFPAFSAAWRISEERFMENFPVIDNLKLRGSWGQSGMLAGSAFQYLSGYTLRGNAYLFGNSGLVQGSQIEQEANPEITWEVSTKTDIGFDLNMWNGLLNLEFDYFHEKRTGMLLAPQVTLPVSYGLSLSQENAGTMKNNGFEFTIGGRKELSSDLEISLSGNFSYAKNKMIEVFESDAQRNNPNRTLTGRSFRTPFGYKALGLFTTDDDKNGDGIINSEDGYNVVQFGELHPGDIKYADLSGPDGVPDNKIDANDEHPIGYPRYPLMTYGLTPGVKWKNLDISLFFQGTAMSSITIGEYQTVPFYNNGSNMGYEYYDNRWTPETQNARYPRVTPAPYGNNTKSSDWWTVSSSYLRLKNMVVAYNLPNSLMDQLKGITGIRVYYTGQNLLTFSNIDFIDPEMGYDQRQTSYPVMRTHMLGLDITF